MRLWGDILKKLTKIVEKVTSALGYVAISIVAVIILCIIINTIGRTLGIFSFGGIIELVQYGMLVAMSMILAGTTSSGLHVRVSLFTDMMPKKAKGITVFAEMLISMITFAVASYQCAILMPQAISMNRITDFYEVPIFLVYLVLSFGLAVAALAFLYNGIAALKHVPENDEEIEENLEKPDL